MKPAVYGRLAALLFAAQAVFPIVHRAVGGEYWGFMHAHNVVIDAGLAFIWSVSAIAGLIQRPPNAFFVMLFVVSAFLFRRATQEDNRCLIAN